MSGCTTWWPPTWATRITRRRTCNWTLLIPAEIRKPSINICAELLKTHASTRERLAYQSEFYAAIFAVTGMPKTILDLACGLNPLAFAWMGLPLTTQYHAYDLHQPRVELINHYFKLQGLAQLAEHGDILVHPPQIQAEVAFFFKEAHRFEQRRRGCNREFWLALNVNWLVVTLPASSLTGRHDLAVGHRKLVSETLAGLDWPMQRTTGWQ